MWPYIDFNRAVEKAVTIVYGKVIDISETKLHETVMSDGEMHQEYYKDITLEVISLLKGESTDSTVIYKELTGEADDCIYGIAGYADLSLDDEILLFANKHGAFLSPEAIIPVVDGVIDPDNLMRPENISSMRSGEISVFDYLDAVEEKLE